MSLTVRSHIRLYQVFTFCTTSPNISGLSQMLGYIKICISKRVEHMREFSACHDNKI